MAATGTGLMKLPSLGSSPLHRHVPISAGDCPPDRRRASITDPSLHAHSFSTLSMPPTPASSLQPHGSLGARSTTLPSLREFNQHPNRAEPEQPSRTLQLPCQPAEHGSFSDPAARRRGSAADLDNILLNANSPDHRYHHPHQHQHPPTPDYPFPSTANPAQPMAEQQQNSHPAHPSEFGPSTGAPTSPSFHMHPQISNPPLSPRSFPSNHSINQHPELNAVSIGPVTNRRPSSAMRRRGSRVNELDNGQAEDPSKLRSSQGSGANSGGSEHPRGFPLPGGSQWPYPMAHHRHHLHQRPSSPMKRRHSSQSISDSTVPPPVYHSLPVDQNGPVDHPWNSPGLHSNHSPTEPLGEYTVPPSGNRLDARRQSATSTVSSSTGTWFDRRQSGESGGCEGADDNQKLIPDDPLRHRSWSSSSNPPFSPSQTAVAASIGNYAFPPLPPGESAEGRPSYRAGLGVVADHGGWNLPKPTSYDDPVAGRRGSGVDEVRELKDRLAGTRLDRLPLHSRPVQEESDAHQQEMDYINQGSRLGTGGALSPYSRSPELKISHKLAERKRRKEMRDLFDELREVLPATDERHSKGSKWETLSRAVDYMQQIRLENERLKADNLQLQGRLNSLNGARVNGTEQDPNQPRFSNHDGHGGFG
ncbi:hypothetical protein PtA15_15A429 [Puccinia triticina]|uniref:BHLH domain-containing protein n=1 Tax=Puccinia triticina TaxID=208348 RepID=A0ABY7D5G3_9BASI|nr:uncharacterized protein PtA15_15A429 [Puccinia triticina]WAQ92034.1 hypothetical protein PtA15_15A429 [Puccinia triticina]